MNKGQVAGLVADFLRSYDSVAKDRIWQQHSEKFRRFWADRVLGGKTAPTDDECDEIIRILDRYGKGNTKESEAVANTRVTQGLWRKMLRAIQGDQNLATLVNSIFQEGDLTRKGGLIDQLYRVNATRNYLTGENGNVINAFLAAYDPVSNAAVISLKDRKTQLDFLGLPVDWENVSIGKKIVESNTRLREGTLGLGVGGSARTQSCFWYFPPMRELWKPQHSVRRAGKEVSVSVPENAKTEETTGADQDEIRKSLQIQAALADIGSQMGFKIWLPRSDRAAVLKKWKAEPGILLENLPGSFEKALIRTIEQIDVLWIDRRAVAIVRAFEIEHTTSVYSGLLRMADLLALNPNLDIKFHIVAPSERRDKVLKEVNRPVFSSLKKPLSELCTYLSYEAISSLHAEKNLKHLSDEVLEDYEVRA